MAASILDGAAVARQVYSELKVRVAALARRDVRPGLAAVLVGDNPASHVYIRTKVRACASAGLHSEVHRLAADCPQDDVLATVGRLNGDPRIHGILVQLPLPGHLDTQRIVQSVASAKDVDGFTWRNLGALVAHHDILAPCTPLGVMRLLEHAGVAPKGRHAVIVGRSMVVGKPMALMLIAQGATVTVCNSATPDLGAICRLADILVVAAGSPRLVVKDMVKPGAVVIDVGINRMPDGKLAGDVDFTGVREVAGWLTPVPGGVGPMTVAMLVANTVHAAELAAATTARKG